MGMMGCTCGDGGKGNEKDNEFLNPNKAEEAVFLDRFNSKLCNIGKTITDEEFMYGIDDKIQSYMKSNPFDETKYEMNYTSKHHETEPVEFKNGNTYKGLWNDMADMEGKGIYVLKQDKVVCEGLWKEGELKKARIFMPDGAMYEGDFQNSLFHGEGILTQFNGDKYIGQFEKGEQNGKGEFIFNDKTKYSGQVKKGFMDGQGKIEWVNDAKRMVYEGNFQNSIICGKGILKNTSNERYEGYFENNSFSGEGKQFFSDGSTYEGNFENNKRHGKGIYIDKTNNLTYEGEWSNDLPSGTGKVTINNAIIKCTWRSGNPIEEPTIVQGELEDSSLLKITPKQFILSAYNMPHLEKYEILSNAYEKSKGGESLSFLNE